jgi:DNA-binding IclR family transcriptional regulator
LPNKALLIIAGTDSPGDIKVTIDIGQHFPPGTPAMARIAMSRMSAEEVDAYVAGYGMSKFAPKTKVKRAEILRELARVGRRGCSISRGECQPGNTAITAPIFTAQDDVCRGLCLIGFSSQIDEKDLAMPGEKVRDTANAITHAIGGREKIKRRATG